MHACIGRRPPLLSVVTAFLVALAALGWAGAGLAAAAGDDAYPTKPVRIIVPFPAGGTTDVLARLVGERLTKALGQMFVVENKSGAGGNIGAAFVAKSAPDGYTLLMGSPGTQSVNVHLFAQPGYDGIKDFAPISLVAKVPNFLVVHPSLPVRTLPEFIAYAKAHPGLRYGHTSVGGSKHLAGELLRLNAGIDIVQVPYKGSAPLITDLVGGHVMVGFDDMLTSLPHVTTGKLRAIAITGPARWPTAPDVPRVAELGGALADYEVTAWYGLLAPAATPPRIVKRLTDEVRKILADTELRQRLFSQGVEPVGNTAEAYRDFILKEHQRWGEVIRKAGIQGN